MIRADRTARDRQVERLRAEGVQTTEGVYRVSMKTYGWDMSARAEDRLMDVLINGAELEGDEGSEESDGESDAS